MEEELTEQQVYDYTKKYEITDDEVLDCVAVYQLLANGDKGIPNRDIKGALQLLKPKLGGR